VKLFVEPSENPLDKFKSVVLELEEDDERPHIRHDWLKAINEGCRNALFNGPVLGYAVQGVTVKLRFVFLIKERLIFF
jgi:hypothetical protein